MDRNPRLSARSGEPHSRDWTNLRVPPRQKSPTEKWTGRAKTSREPATRNVRAWPFTRNRNFQEFVAREEQSAETREKREVRPTETDRAPRSRRRRAPRPGCTRPRAGKRETCASFRAHR